MKLDMMTTEQRQQEAQRHLLTKEQSIKIFQRIILPEVLRRAKTVTNTKPKVVMLGGQPGSGKSGLQTDVTAEIKHQGGAVEIIGDDLRSYHPSYAALMRDDSKSAAFYTDKDAGRWVEMLIEEAQKQKLNVILEGTMRQPEVVANTAKSFKEAGYVVDARVLAVKPEVSWQSVYARYEEMIAKGDSPRFTQQSTHDMAASGLLQSLDKLEHEKLADILSVYNRAGETLYRNEQEKGEFEKSARTAVEAERNKELTPEQHTEHHSRWQSILDKMTRRGASQEDVKKIEMQMNADDGKFSSKNNELTSLEATYPLNYEVPAKIAAKYLIIKNGEQSKFFDKKTPDVIVFEDKGTALKSAREDSTTIAHMIDVAKSKGWDRLVLKGTEAFRREVWLEANLRGLETKGYTPTDKDLSVLMAKQAERSSNQIIDDSTSKSKDNTFVKSETTTIESIKSTLQVAETDNNKNDDNAVNAVAKLLDDGIVHIGRIKEHGVAPFENDPENSASYFVTLDTVDGDKTIWGVDLNRALSESSVREADNVALKFKGQQIVKVDIREKDADGKYTGNILKEEVNRNTWEVIDIQKEINKNLAITEPEIETSEDEKLFLAELEREEDGSFGYTTDELFNEHELLDGIDNDKLLAITEPETAKDFNEPENTMSNKPVAHSLSELERAKVIILRRCLESSIQDKPENISLEKLSAFDNHINELTESGQLSSYLAKVEQPKTTEVMQTEKVRDIASQDYDRDRGK